MNSSLQSKNLLNRWTRYLILLCLAQIVLAVGIYTWNHTRQPTLEAKNVLEFSLSDVDRLVIADASNHATLKKSEGTWLLPEMKNLPVDAKKLDDLFAKLQGTKLTWPVTTTASSHERFEVSSTKFQRRVAFYRGDRKLGELLLGSSPGFKKIHVRRDGDDAVYAVELTSFEFASTDKEWFDKALIAVNNPVKIIGKDYVLQKQGDQWGFENDSTTKLDAAKANELASLVTNLSVLDLVDATPSGDLTQLTVTGDTGERTYEFIKSGDNYYVKRDDKAWYFTVSQSVFNQALHYQKAQLVASDPPQTPAVNPKP